MIVNDFHVMGISLAPDETNAPLVVDANAVPSGAIALEHLQPIAWRHAQIEKLNGGIQHVEFSLGRTLNIGAESLDPLAMKQRFRQIVSEACNHLPYNNVWR